MEQQYLKPVEQSPVYRDKQKFKITDFYNLTDYLAVSLTDSDYNHNLFVDWTKCLYHSLIFDIDIKSSESNTYKQLLGYFENVFKPLLFKYLNVSSLTVVIAMRRDRSGGMHVHIPGFQISHDDYIHLCNLMRTPSTYQQDNLLVELDCPSNMCLVASGKSRGSKSLYVPTHIYKLELDGATAELHLIPSKAAYLMMPIPHPDPLMKTLYFPTRIVSCEEKLAQFKSFVNMRHYRICKEEPIQKGIEEPEGSFCYQFLKRNAKAIGDFQPFGNRVLKTWYKRFRVQLDVGLFANVNKRLRQECIHLQDETNPLQSILTQHSNYILPVFYALCNEMKRFSKAQIADGLIELHEPVKDILSTNFPETRLTFDTIAFCAFHTAPLETREGSFFKHIGMGWDWIFKATKTVEEMQEHLIFVQNRFYPVIKAKENLYIWDPFFDKWQNIKKENVNEILTSLMHEVYDQMTYFEGFSKTHIRLDDETIQAVCKKILVNEAFPMKVLPDSYDELELLYGSKVPEYFFLDMDLHCDDEW